MDFKRNKYKMKNFNRIGSLVFLLILFFTSICFAQKQKSTPNINPTFGDSSLSHSDYLKNLSFETLQAQLKLYKKEFTDFNNKEWNNGDVVYKLTYIKGSKIMLYTYVKNEKIDSIQFYKVESDVRYTNDEYSCISYINKNEIWKFRSFSSKSKLLDVASFIKATIKSDGIIETDILYYLDESLEVEIYNNKLND